MDDFNYNVTDNVVITGLVNTTMLGTYMLQYDVSDSSNNTAITQNRTVTVADLAKPTITLNDSHTMILPYNSTYEEPGYAAIDNVDGDITYMVLVSGMVNTTSFGNYTITYTVTDSSNNTATAYRTVMVIDAPPILELVGFHITISRGVAYVEPGYTAIDDVDGDITGMVQVSGFVGNELNVIYILSYMVEDSAGNAVTKHRAVKVVPDTTPPTITLSGSAHMTIPHGSIYTEPGYTSIDNVDGDITGNVTVSGTVNTGRLGTYVITYSVSDSSGNAASQTRTVTVIYQPDNTPPTITLFGDLNMTIPYGSVWSDPGYVATDDIDGNLTDSVVVTGTGDTSALGIYSNSQKFPVIKHEMRP